MARGHLRFPDTGQPEPDDAVTDALAAFGLETQDAVPADDDFYLWPENVAIFNLWLAVQTQWNTDTGQRTGLDYAGVVACMGVMQLRKKDRQEHFYCLQQMERATLDEWSKKQR